MGVVTSQRRDYYQLEMRADDMEKDISHLHGNQYRPPPHDALGPQGEKGEGMGNPAQVGVDIFTTERLISNLLALLTELVREETTMIIIQRGDPPPPGTARPTITVFVIFFGSYLTLNLPSEHKITPPSKSSIAYAQMEGSG